MDEAGQASTDKTPFQMSDALKEMIMSKKIQFAVYPVVAALSLLAAFSAHAEWGVPDVNLPQAFTSTTTRAQVKAELLQARADGSLRNLVAEYSLPPEALAPTQKTRAQVRAEVQADRAGHYADYVARTYPEGEVAVAGVRRAKDDSAVLAARKAAKAQ